MRSPSRRAFARASSWGRRKRRLIHLAAVYGVGSPSETTVVVDIGGGSVEITRGIGANVETARSFKLGVIRLTERFVKSDPLVPRDERKLVKYIDAAAGEYLDKLAARGFRPRDRHVRHDPQPRRIAPGVQGRSTGTMLRNRRVSAKALHRVKKELVELSLEKRLRVPGLEPRRADLSVAGAVLLDAIVRRLGAEDITLCDMSLREGLVLDYIARHRKEIAQADRYPDIRRRSIVELAERCNYWPEHATQVARLAISIFEETRAVHGLTDREREWLEYAALLHDIGMHISYEGHHKHSYYLIKNGDLRGFEPEEVDTIALVARYHRRGHAEEASRGVRPSAAKAPAGHPDARRDPAAGRKPRSQPRAEPVEHRTARPRRRRAVAGPHERRRGARIVGGRPARGALRAPARQAAAGRNQRKTIC